MGEHGPRHVHRSPSSNSGGGSEPPRVYPVRTPDKHVTRRVKTEEEKRLMPGTGRQDADPSHRPGASPRPQQSSATSQRAAQQREAAARQLRSAASSQQPPQRSARSSQQVPIGENTEIPGQIGERTEVPRAVTPKSPEELEYRVEQDPSLAETQDMDPVEIEKPPMNSGSEARISFGQAAVNLKLVTPSQIQECVNVQRALLAKGQRVPLLGQILVQRGYLDKAGVEKIKSYQQMYQMQDKIEGYQLQEKLGQGAMGTVYKARQVRMDRFVAIKVLLPELAANATIKQRFLQEARASARLNHPNVITGIDAGEVEGLCYFAMEYVEGKTLQQLVKERGAMDERQALEAILQVAKALEHAEKLSLVHRDVKPDNIMITRDRQVKLLDLGLAKVRAAEDIGSAKGMAVGTPNHISPEQAMGRQDIDTRAVAPLAHPFDAVQRLRADEVTEVDQRDYLQRNAPATQDGLYLVPKVIE